MMQKDGVPTDAPDIDGCLEHADLQKVASLPSLLGYSLLQWQNVGTQARSPFVSLISLML